MHSINSQSTHDLYDISSLTMTDIYLLNLKLYIEKERVNYFRNEGSKSISNRAGEECRGGRCYKITREGKCCRRHRCYAAKKKTGNTQKNNSVLGK